MSIRFYDIRFSTNVGVWTLGSSSSIDCCILNTSLSNPYKEVWTQITWQSDNGGSPVVTVDGIASTLLLSAPVGNGNWQQNVYETRLRFNPAAAGVVISGALPATTFNVGQVVIDTQCIPKPSSLALSAVGAIGLLTYASRKRRLAA